MKVGPLILAVLVSFLAGAAATHFYKERSIAEAKREVADKEARLDSLKAVIKAQEADLTRLHIRANRQRDSLNKLVELAAHRQDSLRRRIAHLTESIEPQLPDHLRPAFVELRNAYEDRISLLRAEGAAKDAIIITQDSLIGGYVDVNKNLHAALREAEELRDYWREEAKRDWWENPLVTIPATILTVVAVETAVGAALD